MSSDVRFRRLMDVVGGARGRTGAELEAWLSTECADDLDLLAEARALLAHASDTSLDELTARLEADIAWTAANALEGTSAAPRRIGPYTIVDVLGEGGMGRVYRARQDQPLPREVAVKVVASGRHAPAELVARLEGERRILAYLEHPNIAHVFDAGTTEEGLPYLVMEWVRDALPITSFCDARRLDPRARLRLFGDVLGAVQHAHSKGIVHRDLKPSNVLVSDATGEPLPKIIDFGVAKLADELSSWSSARTAYGARVGTLEYMSPEQAMGVGGAVDTRADIYSLGVLLYELLTGELPVPADTLRGASPGELERLLRHTDPPLPSRRVATSGESGAELAQLRATDARRLARTLRGDLDNIVRMALEKEPERRYASAAHFRDDVVRYLEGRPVSAHPHSLAYVAKRFVGRHRAAAVAVAGGIAVLLPATALAMRLAAERDQARRDVESAGETTAYLQRIFQMPTPTADETAGAEGPRLDTEAELGVVAITYCALGQYDDAMRMLAEAQAARDALGDRKDAATASALHDLGVAELEVGDLAGAQANLRDALAMRADLLGLEHPATASTMSMLAIALPPSEVDAAEAIAREAVAVHRRAQPIDAIQLAWSLENLGFLLQASGRLEESEEVSREALSLRRATSEPADSDLLFAQCSLATLLERTGRSAEAETLLREVLDRRAASLGREHPATLLAHNNLAYLLWRTGQHDRAEIMFREAVSMARSVFATDHPSLALTLSNLGVATLASGDLSVAEASHREALEMDLRLLGPAHPRVAIDMIQLGRVLRERGDAPGAERLWRDALGIQEAVGDTLAAAMTLREIDGLRPEARR